MFTPRQTLHIDTCTRRHCKVWLRACNDLCNTHPTDFGNCGKLLHACSQPYLAVPSCSYRFWYGVICAPLYRFRIKILYKHKLIKNEIGCRDGTVPQKGGEQGISRGKRNRDGVMYDSVTCYYPFLVLLLFGMVPSLHPSS